MPPVFDTPSVLLEVSGSATTCSSCAPDESIPVRELFPIVRLQPSACSGGLEGTG